MNLLWLALAIGTTGPPVPAPPPFAALRAGIHAPVEASSHRIGIAIPVAPPPHRVRHALIGALIGGAAGVVTCTVISNLVKDEGTGFSTCTTKGYLLLGGSGAGLGAVLGLLLTRD